MVRRLKMALAAVFGIAVVGLAIFVLSGDPARAVGIPDQPDATTTTPTTHPSPTTTLVTTVPPTTTAGTTSPPTTHAVSTTVSRSRTTAAPTSSRTTYPYSTYPYSTSTSSTTSSTTTTTIAPIGTEPTAPATVPLATKGTNGHVSPVFPILSGVGIFVALVIGSGRFFMTRTGGSDRKPMPPEED